MLGKSKEQRQEALVNSQKVFTGKVFYQQKSNFQGEGIAAGFFFHLSCCLGVFGKKYLVVNDQTDNSVLPTNHPSQRRGELK